MSGERRKAPSKNTKKTPGDPLRETAEKLEVLRLGFVEDMEYRSLEIERFKEDTLWRLNALSDRTIEIARAEEEKTDARLKDGLARANALVAEWEASFFKYLHDGNFVGEMADDVLRRLLPAGEGRVEFEEGGEGF